MVCVKPAVGDPTNCSAVLSPDTESYTWSGLSPYVRSRYMAVALIVDPIDLLG